MAQWGYLACSRMLALAGACMGIVACSDLPADLPANLSANRSANLSANPSAPRPTARIAAPSDNAILGAWSRNPAGCAQPELTFRRDRLDIHIDADGAPVRFSYAGIHYRFDEGRVAVALGSAHPYGKTADRHVLEFRQDQADALTLLRTNTGDTHFIRCSH